MRTFIRRKNSPELGLDFLVALGLGADCGFELGFW
jgi:hypothetical protein